MCAAAPCLGTAATADPQAPSCPVARAELTTGPRAGRVVHALVAEGEGTPTFTAGNRVVLGHVAQAPPGQRYEARAADVLTTELVAQEVVRTLVGGIGIVAAAPLTTALATAFAVRDRGSRRRAARRRAVAAE